MNPLLMPEIVFRLSRFLPLWTPPLPGDVELRFSPKTLLACLLVCRTWNASLHHLLWYVYDDDIQDQLFSLIPLETFHKNVNHVRAFYGLPIPNLAVHLPNLIELGLGEIPGAASPEMNTIRARMIQLNPHIRKLSWIGGDKAEPLLTGPFRDLPHLTHLTLDSWDGSCGNLKQILCNVADTLTFLSLYHIEGVMDEDLDGVSLPLVTSLDIRLPLPVNEGLWGLPQRCPKLNRMVLSCDELVKFFIQINPSLLVDWLRTSNPVTLTSFEMEDELYISSTIMSVIQSFQALTSLDYRGSLTEAIANTMVTRHGSTLKELQVTITDRGTFSHSAIKILLESCPRLESLFIMSFNSVKDKVLMEELFQVPWACRELKELYLHCIQPTLLPMDEGIEQPSLSLAPPSSSYIGYGWYEHSQTTAELNEIAGCQRTEFVRRLFEHVQEMSQLRAVFLNGVEYNRSSVPKERFDGW
ncbi:hypothetical protein B0O80DRAFT_464092 [Mortierella sp. GBAus27b]|nr:hypothetical protein BGX31_007690 [Mortierella sp. GBA43]KAI8347956.1 hypothetical protein B0O80DRAFT_464092 [Mortierella sp. GBAus27b]